MAFGARHRIAPDMDLSTVSVPKTNRFETAVIKKDQVFTIEITDSDEAAFEAHHHWLETLQEEPNVKLPDPTGMHQFVLDNPMSEKDIAEFMSKPYSPEVSHLINVGKKLRDQEENKED